jgi:hypothetical protein
MMNDMSMILIIPRYFGSTGWEPATYDLASSNGSCNNIDT